MNDQLVGYFGFGSLVNISTLRTSYVATKQVTLKGWRRHWQSRPQKDELQMALLSIHPHSGSELLGLMVIDNLANLQKVDEREHGYRRVQLSLDDFVVADDADKFPEKLYVYVANAPLKPEDEPPLLQSYLDAVMQGYQDQYGARGLSHFIATTIGFEREIILDRAEPRYPRAIELDSERAHFFDDTLKSAGVLF